MINNDNDRRGPKPGGRRAAVRDLQRTGTIDVRHGDCLDALRTLPDASIDAIVTDPPYELTGKSGTGGFMGKRWDGTGIAYSVELWRECLRVLKPGGHLAAFGGTRTYHRMACAVEDAGFEIRDSLSWLYGSGFPKSLDVGKAIDKRPGVVRHVEFAAHLADRRANSGLSRADVSERVVGTRTGACWNWEHHQFPEAKWWPALRDLLGLDAKWDAVIAEADREVVGERERKATGRMAQGEGGYAFGEQFADTAPATDAARTWQGWGTALKPAVEPIVLARKPLVGTVAVNVQEHGTGALNIDGCRVASGEDDDRRRHRVGGFNESEIYGTGRTAMREQTPGRWPSNVLLSHGETCGQGFYSNPHACQPGCPVAELDTQSGTLTSGANPKRRGADNARQVLGEFGGQDTCDAPRGVDSGGASRFFPTFRYQAKAPKSERPKVDGVGHPTVKPLALMQWLVRLITPPGGVVLDPFAGSGTTGQAASLEGFDAILIEREADYLPLIAHRLGIEVADLVVGKALEIAEPIPVTAADIEHGKALAELQGREYVPWPAEVAPVVLVDPVLVAIGEALTRDVLVAVWRAHKDSWTDEYQLAVKTALASIEAVA